MLEYSRIRLYRTWASVQLDSTVSTGRFDFRFWALSNAELKSFSIRWRIKNRCLTMHTTFSTTGFHLTADHRAAKKQARDQQDNRILWPSVLRNLIQVTKFFWTFDIFCCFDFKAFFYSLSKAMSVFIIKYWVDILWRWILKCVCRWGNLLFALEHS